MNSLFHIFIFTVSLCATSWSSSEFVLDKDKKIFKKHHKSLIEWEKTDARRWLDLDAWIKSRDYKDKNKNWKVEKRIKTHKELVGTIVQCLGECKVYGKFGGSLGRFKTKIYEGDEVQTFEKSSAWIVLMDGSLIRLSAFSSIAFFEINFSKKESMVSYRLNRGHVFVSSRSKLFDYSTDLMQTDTAFFPLHYIEANQEYYMRREYVKLNAQEQMKYALELNPGATLLQSRLNKLINENPQKRKTTHLVVSANNTIIIRDGEFHLFYETRGEANFYAQRAENIQLGLRGYTNEERSELEVKKYYKISKKGDSFDEDNSLIDNFSVIRYLVSRIPSIYMAREIELTDFYKVLKNEDVRLGLDYNYFEWDDDKLKTHIDELVEYSRRIETTNLTVMEKYFKSSKTEGFDTKYYQHTYSLQLANLSNKNYEELEKIKSLDKARYYLWVMENGKKFISTSFRK